MFVMIVESYFCFLLDLKNDPGKSLSRSQMRPATTSESNRNRSQQRVKYNTIGVTDY
jgi:hypothetical protein